VAAALSCLISRRAMSRFKVPEVVEHRIEPQESDKPPYYHVWSCGCRSRITDEAFELIYCSETCVVYLAVMEEINEPSSERPK
jgi:hypothetical protein